MELKFVAAKKAEATDPVLKRRQRLAQRIDQQIGLIHNVKDGQLPRKSWAWIDDQGNHLVGISYGHTPLELKKGMFAIQCENVKLAADALEAIKAMVMQGSYDDQLTKISQEIRRRFKTTDLAHNRML